MEHPGPAASRSWVYGRRKFIPIFFLFAPLFAWRAATAHLVVLNLAMLVWATGWAWRYWVEPMPPRLAKRIANNAAAPRFGHLLWHKLALGFVAVLVLLFGTLIVVAAVGSH